MRRPKTRLHSVIAAIPIVLAATAAAQTNINGTMQHGGMTRTFIVHLPPGFSAGQPKPLVVALHPKGTSGAQFQSTAGWDDVSNQNGLVVVYPDGGLPADTNGGYAWNAWDFTGGSPDDIGFLSTLIARVQALYGVDRCRTYMTGFSSGAMMTNTFASAHADQVAAIAPVSGGWITAYGGSESQLMPSVPVPVWTWRGSDETFVTGEGSSSQPRDQQDQEQLAYWIGHDQATYQSTTVEQLTYQVPRIYVTRIYAGAAPVRFTEVQGTGHIYQPGAADLVWNRFFSQIVSQSHGCGSCPTDIDRSGATDGADLGRLLSAWGTDDPAADLNGDGIVSGADLGILLAAWGPC